jgi:hypothetical protein
LLERRHRVVTAPAWRAGDLDAQQRVDGNVPSASASANIART